MNKGHKSFLSEERDQLKGDSILMRLKKKPGTSKFQFHKWKAYRKPRRKIIFFFYADYPLKVEKDQKTYAYPSSRAASSNLFL